MVASTDTKYFLYTNANAPQLTNVWGQLCSLLDACLVDGFNQKSISSLSIIGNVITANYFSAHGYLDGQVLLLSGATEATLNKEHRITSVTSTTLTFEVDVIPSTLSGSIISKLAPIGITKYLSDSSKRIYYFSEMTDPTYLRVDEATLAAASVNYRGAIVRISKACTNINTLPNAVPVATTPKSTDPLKWIFSTTTTARTHAWLLVGSKKGFYFFPAAGNYTPTDYMSAAQYGVIQGSSRFPRGNTVLLAQYIAGSSSPADGYMVTAPNVWTSNLDATSYGAINLSGIKGATSIGRSSPYGGSSSGYVSGSLNTELSDSANGAHEDFITSAGGAILANLSNSYFLNASIDDATRQSLAFTTTKNSLNGTGKFMFLGNCVSGSDAYFAIDLIGDFIV
ncbi:hypothetical protein [Acinetobacter towneri]|uniref:Uncharacterized protein n=1 Tax=Acinetobacter towneri TaxID=202956 RepID=A0A1E8E552_9GAMM|nr:hypothetical protein [Acinetobacter towneri]OFE44636.1 hypothetical protein BJN41_00470 [Acinetobacter towneri]